MRSPMRAATTRRMRSVFREQQNIARGGNYSAVDSELIFANRKKSAVKPIAMTTGAKSEIQFFRVGWKPFKRRELVTTQTELNAIASPASSGRKISPQCMKALAARGGGGALKKRGGKKT